MSNDLEIWHTWQCRIYPLFISGQMNLSGRIQLILVCFFLLIYMLIVLFSWLFFKRKLKLITQLLTQWDWVTHLCVSNLKIIGSDNGLSTSTVRRQVIIRTNAGILLIRTLGTNFSEILIEIHMFPLKEMHLKCCLGNDGHFVSAPMEQQYSLQYKHRQNAPYTPSEIHIYLITCGRSDTENQQRHWHEVPTTRQINIRCGVRFSDSLRN